MFILASKSPRRKQLFSEKISNDFKIVPSDIDEHKFLNLPYKKAVKEISYAKAMDIAKKYPNDVVIGADTIVVLNKKIIGKPVDVNDAIKILHSLSGKTHKVLTSFVIVYDNVVIQKTVTSKVTFNFLTDSLIKEYVHNKNPLDKAGAYGVQDTDYNLVKKVKGSVNNVIGFPVEEILKILHQRKLI